MRHFHLMYTTKAQSKHADIVRKQRESAQLVEYSLGANVARRPCFAAILRIVSCVKTSASAAGRGVRGPVMISY